MLLEEITLRSFRWVAFCSFNGYFIATLVTKPEMVDVLGHHEFSSWQGQDSYALFTHNA
jgi:hypothetical protein